VSLERAVLLLGSSSLPTGCRGNLLLVHQILFLLIAVAVIKPGPLRPAQ
jgi:hypothetical protein